MSGRVSRGLVLAAIAGALLAVPLAVWAAGAFRDVPDSSVFSADVRWLAETGVTKGCNPPDNTLFCPEDAVTRQEMAAFLHRLAVNRVVDADTANVAEEAATIDGLGKQDILATTAVAGRNSVQLDSPVPRTLHVFEAEASEVEKTAVFVDFHGYFGASGIESTSNDHHMICWISATEYDEYDSDVRLESEWQATYPSGKGGVGSEESHAVPFALSLGLVVEPGAAVQLYLQCADVLAGGETSRERFRVHGSGEMYQVITESESRSR